VSGHDIIVIGASAGGLQALKQLLTCLPPRLPAACFAVVHRQEGRETHLPGLLQSSGALAVKLAEDGEPIRHGTLLVGPSDRHLVVLKDRIRLSEGPRENFWRPSIDVLCRPAAVNHRSRVIGVVLSGTLDDGVAGLAAVRACGGEALVQQPEEAPFAELPRTALRQVEGARCLPIVEMGREIVRLVATEARELPPVPPELELEARIASSDTNLVSALAMPDEMSLYNCPECGGPLAAEPNRPLRYRCTVGHAFTASSLEDGMRHQIESSLWVAIRLLQQRSNLNRTLSEKEREKGRLRGADNYLSRAEEDWGHSDVLRRLLMQLNAGTLRPTVAEDLS
jgi:two-component system, chemotaxis family, protein-glutamate methylesterase/glutaminase